MKRKLCKVILAGVTVAAIGGGTVASAAPNQPSSVLDLGVVVQNDATEPVPVTVGNLPGVQAVKPATPQQVLLQGSVSSGIARPLWDDHNDTTILTTRIGISNITISNPYGPDAIVRLSAGKCGEDPASYGEWNLMVAPTRQTVQANHPAALVFPPTETPPSSWCLNATAYPIDPNAALNQSVYVTVVASVAN